MGEEGKEMNFELSNIIYLKLFISCSFICASFFQATYLLSYALPVLVLGYL